VNGADRLLAHGIATREDLPIPFSFALGGAVAALVVSFLVLAFLWREPRLDADRAGRPVPQPVARVVDSRGFRFALRLLGAVVTAYVVMAAVIGRDDALNPVPGVVYAMFWVGVPLASILFGPVWRRLNPIRAVHWAVARALGGRPDQGLARPPRWLGYWPAALSLFAFTWLELIDQPDNDTLPVLRTWFAVYLLVHLLAATVWGSGWFRVGDGFEVYSSLFGRLSVLGRRGNDRRLVLHNPLAGVSGTPIRAGLVGVVTVLLGSTAYDALANAPWWIVRVQTWPLPAKVTETLGLLGTIALIAVAFTIAARLSGLGTGLSTGRLTGEYSHSLVPIAAGYVVAHYWSFLVIVGQQTVIELSDPLGTGANWLGTGNRAVAVGWVGATAVATVQVCAIVLGHVLGVVLAHDRAVRLLPRSRAVVGQIPMMVLMVGYTVGGLLILFAA
jgi:hypothetical protein